MTTESQRRLLPMFGHTKGKRSAVTCDLKCDNACAKATCNTSDNNYFRDIVSAEYSRRSMLGVGAVGALTLLFGGGAVAQAPGAQGLSPAAKLAGGKLQFEPIAPVHFEVDEFTVPKGYTWETIIKWGDPLFKDAPEFDVNNQTPEAQAGQFGYNNDYVDILETNDKGTEAVMVVNHEYTNEPIMFPPGTDPATIRSIAKNAHGMSVVELERKRDGFPWKYVRDGKLNRRLTVSSTFALTGPAAGSPLVQTKDDPEGRTVRGTLNNCAGGTTPWGTILSGEENFQGYFKAGAAPTAEQKRYGVTNPKPGRAWHLDEERFDTTVKGYENEPNRFGWIVELDPMDPESTPVKHTAMGRMKHEGANVTLAGDGRVVAYMGDDERFEYLYKFVSRDTYIEGNRDHNKTLMANGDLYVATFAGDTEAEIDGSGRVPSDGAFDGTGAWLPLTAGGVSVVPGMTTEQVLVYTRFAADKVGATKMDRPEDVEPNPATGKVYMACTNNSARGVGSNPAANEANPRNQNRDGHIVEITEAGNDAKATTFNWNLLMVCGDPAQGDATYFSGYPVGQVSPISCPDNVAFDRAGNLWIATDGAPNGINYNDGLFKVTLDGAERGNVEQFLSVPRDAETCGPIIHDDEGMVFVAVQHPGEDGAWGAHTSLFPYDGTPAPRPSVVQVFRGKRSKGQRK